MKKLLIFAGIISLGLGILGVFLPILPTTPFVLLSAWLFSQSSEKLHNWLLNHKMFGKLIRDYTEDKLIPLHAKIIAIVMLCSSIIYTMLVFATGKLWLQIILAIIALGVSIHISSYKSSKKR